MYSTTTLAMTISSPTHLDTFSNFSINNSWQIILSIIGGIITVAIIELVKYLRKKLYRKKFKSVFGKDIANPDGIFIVYTELQLPDVFNNRGDFITHPYFKPDQSQVGLGFSIDRPVSSCEVRAIKYARNRYRLDNIWVMLPFVRTTWEVEKALKIIREEGLKRGKKFKVWLMAEVPSIVFLAEEFSKLCDGFSIGSNDLTQLVLGVDRDSEILGKMGYFDERNEAVKRAIEMLIKKAHENGKTVSICGQAPSVYPEFTEFLVKSGIDSISVNPDVVVRTRKLVYEIEKRLKK